MPTSTILHVLDLDEQYNPDTDQQMSAKQLTWNYTELYFTYKIMNNLNN